MLTIAVVTPLRARLEEAGEARGQQGSQQAQSASALVEMRTATARQAEAVVVLQRQQAQEAALRQAQEEAARQAQALAAQQQAEALAAQQAQIAAQQAAQTAALQQQQAQEAAARRAQAAAERQAQAAQRQAEAAAQQQESGFIQPAADSLTPLERSIFNTVNQQRAAAGLGPLQIDYTLVAAARAHSAQMSAGNRLFHTTNLAAAAPSKWRSLGENVAMSTSVDTMNARLMESPVHRGNILGSYDHVGIGVVVAGNKFWVTQEFMSTS